MTYTPAKGDDVWVDFQGREWPGEVEKVEHMGMVRCTIHTTDEPDWDFGSAGARVMPVQTVAVRSTHIRPREADGA